ncbi:hypothetical protein GCM10027346_24110 [Hymenobacter seoulensis]
MIAVNVDKRQQRLYDLLIQNTYNVVLQDLETINFKNLPHRVAILNKILDSLDLPPF